MGKNTPSLIPFSHRDTRVAHELGDREKIEVVNLVVELNFFCPFLVKPKTHSIVKNINSINRDYMKRNISAT